MHPSPVHGGALPWWGVSEWCGRRGSSWRCPHSWYIHPPYLGWPGASRKNTGRHNTAGAETEAHTVLEATVPCLSAKIRTGLLGSMLRGRLGVATSRKHHWHLGRRAQGCWTPERQIFHTKELAHPNCHYHPLWESNLHAVSLVPQWFCNNINIYQIRLVTRSAEQRSLWQSKLR